MIDEFFRTARRSELVKLQAAYEAAVYTNQYIRPNNSYEKRRLSALAIGPKGLKASAAAAAITFVSGKVHPGDSTDGAIFFPVPGRNPGQGKIVAQLGGARPSSSCRASAGPAPGRSPVSPAIKAPRPCACGGRGGPKRYMNATEPSARNPVVRFQGLGG